MVENGYTINSMYVTRDEDGTINLFGAHLTHNGGSIIVFESTKNVEGIGQKLYGDKYTNEYLISYMKKRPAHNFIGQIGGPVSFACARETVSFV